MASQYDLLFCLDYRPSYAFKIDLYELVIVFYVKLDTVAGGQNWELQEVGQYVLLRYATCGKEKEKFWDTFKKIQE